MVFPNSRIVRQIVYVTNGISSVFDSQVLTLLNYYVDQKWFSEVILLFGYQNAKEIDWIQKKSLDKLRLVLFKSYPNYPIFNLLLQNSLFNCLKSSAIDYSTCIFHIRGEVPSYHLKKVASKLRVTENQILTDIRGVRIEELEQYNISNKVIKTIKLINYKNAFKQLHKDHKISVVSNALKKHLVEKLNITPDYISINSCLTSEKFVYSENGRLRIRRELKIIDDEVLLIFSSGGTSKWQNNEMILVLAQKGFKVLNLSKVKIEHINIINCFVSYDEMPDYLSASDVSFIWRDESIVNKVSSPVKLSEYLCCGLPVIHNGTIDLLSSLPLNYNESILTTSIDDISIHDVTSRIKLVNRNRLSKNSRHLFGVEIIANQYSEIYFNKLK